MYRRLRGIHDARIRSNMFSAEGAKSELLQTRSSADLSLPAHEKPDTSPWNAPLAGSAGRADVAQPAPLPIGAPGSRTHDRTGELDITRREDLADAAPSTPGTWRKPARYS